MANKGEWDLPNVGNLKRTGKIGELMTGDRRKREIEANKKELESSQNARAGIVKKWMNTDVMLSTPSQRKDFKVEEKNKEKRKSDAEKRIKELKTYRE